MLNALEHVQIPVRHLDRAIAWYTEHLGFRLDSRDGERTAFISLPEGPVLMLWQSNDGTNAHFSVDGTDFPVLLYRTERIHELHEHLVREKTTIQLFQDDGFAWVLKFYDPEGNLWGVLQMKSGSETEQFHLTHDHAEVK